MSDRIEIPEEFGGSWEAFLREWRLDSAAIPYNPAQVSRGLLTLTQLWPEAVARMREEPRRGYAVCVSAIHDGLLLEACQTVKYFRQVLDRLKLDSLKFDRLKRDSTSHRSAYSELLLVYGLRCLGYDAIFEARDPGSPDAQCTVDGGLVCFEVYTPDPSYASLERLRLAGELQEAVTRELSNCRVEIGFFDAFRREEIAAAVEVIRSAPSTTWTYVGDWARVRRVDRGQSLPPVFDAAGAQVSVASETTTLDAPAASVIRWEESDKRAEIALQKKRAQLSEGVANVVVMDVCAVVGAIDEWPEAIARLLGPDYEKIGAVAFLQQGTWGPPRGIRRRWRIVVNPNAQVQIPEALLADLESLDESSYLGFARNERLVASATGGR